MKLKIFIIFLIFSLLKFSLAAPEDLKNPSENSVTTNSTDLMKEIPSLVYLEIFSTDSDGDEIRKFCGATPVNKQWILTSALCLTKTVTKIKIYPNSNGDKKLNLKSSKNFSADPKNIFIHENFTHNEIKNELRHDLALIFLEEKLDVEIFELPPKVFKPTPVGVVTNMKMEKEEISLELISYQAASVEICKSSHLIFNESEQLCMKSNLGALCENDVGNGLVSKFNDKNYIFGVFSYGTDCNEGEPTIFTRVSAYKKWIEKTIKTKVENGTTTSQNKTTTDNSPGLENTNTDMPKIVTKLTTISMTQNLSTTTAEALKEKSEINKKVSLTESPTNVSKSSKNSKQSNKRRS